MQLYKSLIELGLTVHEDAVTIHFDAIKGHQSIKVTTLRSFVIKLHLFIPFFIMENVNAPSPPELPTSPISRRVQKLDKLLECLDKIVPPPTNEPYNLEEEPKIMLVVENKENKELEEEFEEEFKEEFEKEEEDY
nr:hypothetical protein [Tanacetum cinerariifolium]GEW67354.1 hypothetical protein [Tanacetum cinerariifolium]